MIAGTWLAGIMADWSIFRSLIIGGTGMAATMLAFWLAAPHGWAALPVVFAITTLDEAIDTVETIADGGDTSSLARCTAS